MYLEGLGYYQTLHLRVAFMAVPWGTVPAHFRAIWWECSAGILLPLWVPRHGPDHKGFLGEQVK